MGFNQLKGLKRLQQVNEQLRRDVSDLTLDVPAVPCRVGQSSRSLSTGGREGRLEGLRLD